jgi:hypothetical protein
MTMDASLRELLLQLSLEEFADILQECTSSEFSQSEVLAMRQALADADNLEALFEHVWRLLSEPQANAA